MENKSIQEPLDENKNDESTDNADLPEEQYVYKSLPLVSSDWIDDWERRLTWPLSFVNLASSAGLNSALFPPLDSPAPR